VKIGDNFADLSERETAALSKILPVPNKAARPIDLFERAQPRIWVLPVDTPALPGRLAAVFNWNEHEEQSVPLSFQAMGLDPKQRYAVYDFWNERFLGVWKKKMTVKTPPGSVRLLCFRPYRTRPMFLSTDRHISQGATDITALTWDDATRQYKGAMKGIRDTEYTLRFLLPKGYDMKYVNISTGCVKLQGPDEVLAMTFYCSKDGPVTWTMQF